jgi:hypothetical protein
MLLAAYLLSKVKPNKFSDYIKLITRTLPYLFLYGFLLYFLEMEKIITAGWVFYSLMFFLVPIAAIILCIRLFYWIRERRSAV